MLRCDAVTLVPLNRGSLDQSRSNWLEDLESPGQRDAHSPSESEVKAAVEATFGRDRRAI